MPSQKATHPSTEHTARTWDGSPQTKYEWFESLQHTLTSRDVSFRTLWQSGYMVDRTKVLVSDELHAKHLAAANVDKRPFNNPTQSLKYQLIDTPNDVSTAILDANRYVVAPELLDAKDRSLFAAIADTIDNKKRRDDYEQKSDGSGLKLIKLLATEIEQASAEISQWAARRLADVVASGLTSPTTVGFDQFRKQYEEANAQMPATRRNQPTVVADTYVAMVRQLGENIGTRLDMQLTLTRIGKGAGAALTLEETVNCILEVLSDSELRHTGHALKTGRDSRPMPPLVWTEGKHDPCSICNGKHGGGKHLRRDCPDKPKDPIKKGKSDRPPSKDSSSKGSAKRATGTEFDESVDLAELWEADTPVALLFSDEPSDSPHYDNDELDDNSESESAGQAYVARGKPATSEHPESALATPTPRPSLQNAQRLIQSLSPMSKMKEFTEVEQAVQTGVSLRTGGSDRRSRLDILSDMRAAVGLSPHVVPVGLPMGPSVEIPRCALPVTTDCLMTDLTSTRDPSAELLAPPGTLTTSVESPSAPNHPPSVSNPLGIIWEVGAPQLTSFCISTDEDGQILHQYSFCCPTGEHTWSHPAVRPTTAAAPPPNATYLGSVPSMFASCWGTDSGELILVTARTPKPTSTHRHVHDQRAPDQRARGSNHSRTPLALNGGSPMRGVAVAVLSLAGALTALALGASSPDSNLAQDFNPGIVPASNSTALDIATAMVLIGWHLARQANAGGGGRPRRRRLGSAAPASTAQRWAPIYCHDLSLARDRLWRCRQIWRQPCRLVSALLDYLVLLALCRLALACNLMVSTSSPQRAMHAANSVEAIQPITYTTIPNAGPPRRSYHFALERLCFGANHCSLRACRLLCCTASAVCVSSKRPPETADTAANPSSSRITAHSAGRGT